MFGVPVGFLVLVVVSLVTEAPDRETAGLVDYLRYPNLEHSDSGLQ